MFTQKQLDDFVHALSLSAQPSVDAFLEHQIEYTEIGKAAIALSLIKCENEKTLFGRVGSTGAWYDHLLNQHMNCRFEDFEKNQLRVVTFNYDRSFEHFLFTALSKRYGKADAEVAEAMKTIEVVHIYGDIGQLPWQSDVSRKYCEEFTREDIELGASRIKVVEERGSVGEGFKRARELFRWAQCIFFLGFGYDPTNLRRLEIPFGYAEGQASEVMTSTGIYDGLRVHKRIAGTSLGKSAAEADELMKAVSKSDGLILGDRGHDILNFLRNYPDVLGISKRY